ncbi:hypothetical protein GCM10010464_38650 [Pseudonocardia yunnanensis]|uniref:Uncharacterized protein n=1 Tax=Pseudonocardia yunnanensis TaxID=58107 RepID=A0ABW4FB78_9PSEU
MNGTLTPDEQLAKQSIEDFGRFRTGDELAAFLLSKGVKGARVKGACPVATYIRGFTNRVRILVSATTTQIWSKNLTTVPNPQALTEFIADFYAGHHPELLRSWLPVSDR